MDIQSDFKDLLELFNKYQVKFLIVGGYALAFHGAPRMTGDIDLFIDTNSQNAQRIMQALGEFGFGDVGLTLQDFILPEKVIQLGVPPVRVDILTSLSGVSWEKAYRSKESGKYGNVPVFYINKELFLFNKRAIGRKKDEADIEALGE
ncbi:MAG: hypothetical protein A2306_11415 [Omnitrophica WOR_2 bacterium RIFOXYB2_FULL_38_16]|nr:MAG: hypothetical protein A2243_05015 [Omnitrophica WOR_2 bacterium RIFOXYA2_FULL_38_17]OGX55526.1 MAG: hypothetical protein A2306_11415 [Omnitrophica WOR_2 bacterium RIFOXYB2_FULL_38_16]OGX58017.1 MAG: hypothetical protein A2447_00255 [Omnitrophica WOR_2 bacterium RIFOXYC2_FULL_38_12]HBG62313.1 hypothetical protein [Candidatus Omnitrophota bacterium]